MLQDLPHALPALTPCADLHFVVSCPALGGVNFSEDNLSLLFSMCLPACPHPTLEHLLPCWAQGQQEGLCPSVRTGFRVSCLLCASQAACPSSGPFPALLLFWLPAPHCWHCPVPTLHGQPCPTPVSAPAAPQGWLMFCRPGAAGASASAQSSLAWSSVFCSIARPASFS